ncbi:MAG: hypothetical protein ACREWI_08750 [Telluria sp.]
MGLLLACAGLALGMLAWSLHDFWWSVAGAGLLTAGFLLLWRRERDDELKEVAAEIHDVGLGWRFRGRRGGAGRDRDGDGDGDAGDAGSFDGAAD